MTLTITMPSIKTTIETLKAGVSSGCPIHATSNARWLGARRAPARISACWMPLRFTFIYAKDPKRSSGLRAGDVCRYLARDFEP